MVTVIRGREDERAFQGSTVGRHEYFYMTWGFFLLGFEIYSEYLKLSSLWRFSRNDEVSLCFGDTCRHVITCGPAGSHVRLNLEPTSKKTSGILYRV